MSKKLNGSADLLSKAIKCVFDEAIESLDSKLESMATKDDVQSIKHDVSAKIDNTNKNFQAQLAQHRKDTIMDIKEIVKSL